jgi:hypothetical protein
LAEILRKKAHDAGIKMSLDDILELRCNLRRWMRLRKSYLRW